MVLILGSRLPKYLLNHFLPSFLPTQAVCRGVGCARKPSVLVARLVTNYKSMLGTDTHIRIDIHVHVCTHTFRHTHNFLLAEMDLLMKLFLLIEQAQQALLLKITSLASKAMCSYNKTITALFRGVVHTVLSSLTANQIEVETWLSCQFGWLLWRLRAVQYPSEIPSANKASKSPQIPTVCAKGWCGGASLAPIISEWPSDWGNLTQHPLESPEQSVKGTQEGANPAGSLRQEGKCNDFAGTLLALNGMLAGWDCSVNVRSRDRPHQGLHSPGSFCLGSDWIQLKKIKIN